MRYVEKLEWILDRPSGDDYNFDEEYKIKKDFVHSLGYKCDCVGMSQLTPGTPEADRVLNAIADFCKKEGWYARGWYTREYVDVESDWYVLEADYVKDGTIDSTLEAPSISGETVEVNTFKAYREMIPAPKCFCYKLFVPDRFRKACEENQIFGGQFCWVKDNGKYQAEQYFSLFADYKIPQVAWDKGLDYEDEFLPLSENGAYPPVKIYERMVALGGSLPQLAEIFSSLKMRLPDCYLASHLEAEELANVDIVSALYPHGYTYAGKPTMLIRKSAAERLLREGAITPKSLRPAPIVDAFPGGYAVSNTMNMDRPTQEYADKQFKQYEKLMETPRPARKISEKDSLKVLRAAKKERKEEFLKAMPKAKVEALAGTPYAPLISYYRITLGGYLSDEYRLLTVEESVLATEEWHDELSKEEQLETPPTGVVIAKCADGDVVVLTAEGIVIRFSHEVPEILQTWETSAAFVFEAITESE